MANPMDSWSPEGLGALAEWLACMSPASFYNLRRWAKEKAEVAMNIDSRGYLEEIARACEGLYMLSKEGKNV